MILTIIEFFLFTNKNKDMTFDKEIITNRKIARFFIKIKIVEINLDIKNKNV